jgi:hypothetical protein
VRVGAVSPRGNGVLVDAWQLTVKTKRYDRVVRFMRPEAAAEVLEKLGIREQPSAQQVLKTRKIPLYGQHWSIKFAPITQHEFNHLERQE